jgi:RimJ/RimL family protein N-acetyltransferase
VPPTREFVASIVADGSASLERPGLGMWLLEADGVPHAGCVGLRPHAEPATAELIYLLDPGLWGQGLATRMAWTAIDRGFRSRALGRVLAVTDGGNRASRRLMVRLGMRHRREVEHPLGPGPECVLEPSDAGPSPRPALLPML